MHLLIENSNSIIATPIPNHGARKVTVKWTAIELGSFIYVAKNIYTNETITARTMLTKDKKLFSH